MDAVNYHPTARGSNTAKCSNITIMNIKEIINSGTNVQIVINALDLKEAFLQWCEEQKQQQPEEQYLTAKETADRLHVDVTTLWRWDKAGYLKRVKLGNKPYYRMSDIKKLMER